MADGTPIELPRPEVAPVPPLMDPVRAVALAAEIALTGTPSPPLSETALRQQLPDMGMDPGGSVFRLLTNAAGVTAPPKRVKPRKLRDEDCPLVIRRVDGDGVVSWHVLAGAPQEGLGTELLPDGTRSPVALEELTTKGRLDGWALRPLDGPERSEQANASTKDTYQLPSFWPSRQVLIPIVLATLTINLLALAVPLATMNIFDRVISNAAFETLWMLTLGVVLALAFDFLLRGLRASVLDRSSARADVLAMNGVFGRVLGARMGARRSTVGLQVNSLREFETVREYFNASAIAALGDLPFVAIFLVVIWAVAGPLVLVPLIAVPLFLITALIIQLRLRRLVEGSFQDTAQKNAVATEILTGIESIKLAGGEPWAALRWEKAVASQLRHSLAIRFWTNASIHLITMFQGMVTISILVVGVYLVTEQAITPGALFASNLLAGRCLAPLAAVAALIARLTQVRMARQAVTELASMENERPSGRRLVRPGSFNDAITFEDVAFNYSEDGPTVLRGISTSITAGERVAILGGIGSGKSTLVKLISGLEMPSSGRVLVDGLSTTDIDLDAWRAQLGISPQNPAYLSGTVRDAVAMGRVIGDGAIIKALNLSGGMGWISATGLGLDTPLGERGIGLSGGQLQTLAVARAIVGAPPLVLLDEPTSHMDGRSEAAFVSNLKAMDKNTTIITVTHRPTLIEAAERLIVVESGAILLDGPRDEVLTKLRGVVDKRKIAAGGTAA